MLVDTIDKIGYLQRLTNTLDALAEKVPQSTADVDALIGLIKQAQASMPRVSRVMSAPLENYDILSSQVARALPPTIAADKCLHIIALQGAQRYQNLPDCITQHTVGPDIDASVNAIVKAARDEDLILFVHQDDRLKLDQLGWFFDSAKQNPEKSVFLSDFEEEDLPVMHGIFDPDHFLAANPYRHCFAVRATALKRNLQNFIEDGKQLDVEDWSFRQLLKLLDREGEARFSTIQRMVWETNKRSVISADQPIREWTFTNDPTPELVSNYIASKGHKVAVEPLKDNFSGSLPYARSIRYQAPADDKLAVIIPTRNALEITRACVESLMATAADVALLDIMIVNNQSDDEATLAWFEDVTKHPAVRVIDYDDKFNWSAINNEAVKQTDADKLLFLNNDTLALSQDWDLITRGELEREDVGIVGARLLYEDGSIQHGGIILYDVGVATHDGIASWPSKGGYYNRTKVRHASAGATGAYLAVRRDVFDAVEGFDAENLRITFNDIDFGLKVMRADKKILYLPDITFHHLESKTRGFDYADEKKRERALKEKEWMEQKWRGTLRHDPYYPPAFLRQGRPFGFLDARSKKW